MKNLTFMFRLLIILSIFTFYNLFHLKQFNSGYKQLKWYNFSIHYSNILRKTPLFFRNNTQDTLLLNIKSKRYSNILHQKPTYAINNTYDTILLDIKSKGIQHCLFINLDHRKDRLNDFTTQMNSSGLVCTRVTGVKPTQESHQTLLNTCYDDKICPGQLGCQLSHLKVVDLAIKNKWNHVAIFEDDFIFRSFFSAKHLQIMVESIIQKFPYWAVIGLSLNIGSQTITDNHVHEQYPHVKSTLVHDAQTTGGLIFRNTSILQRYRDLISLENCDVRKDYQTAIDQCMKPMQKEFHWIGMHPQIGTQKASFSDIEQMEVNYQLTR